MQQVDTRRQPAHVQVLPHACRRTMQASTCRPLPPAAAHQYELGMKFGSNLQPVSLVFDTGSGTLYTNRFQTSTSVTAVNEGITPVLGYGSGNVEGEEARLHAKPTARACVCTPAPQMQHAACSAHVQACRCPTRRRDVFPRLLLAPRHALPGGGAASSLRIDKFWGIAVLPYSPSNASALHQSLVGWSPFGESCVRPCAVRMLDAVAALATHLP